MPQTPVTSSTAYCTPARLLTYVDWGVAADCLAEGDGPRPSRASLLDATADAGAVLADLCLAATGAVESACLARSLYHPDDLNALTGAAKALREKVTAGLVVKELFGRKRPGTGKAEDWPIVGAAEKALADLGAGVRIFPTAEARDAGAGMTAVEVPAASDPDRTVARAGRFFGSRGRT